MNGWTNVIQRRSESKSRTVGTKVINHERHLFKISDNY